MIWTVIRMQFGKITFKVDFSTCACNKSQVVIKNELLAQYGI